MRKEIKDFLKSDKMVLLLPRDRSKDVISQWIGCRNNFVPPINFLLANFAKIIPFSKWISSYYRFFFGMKIGKNVGFALIDPDYLLPEAIEIGDNSAIGWKTKLMTHEFTGDTIRFGKIIIGKNVLIGGFCVVRGGVKIGDNSILSACSFLRKDIPPNELWGGVPAKKIMNLKEPSGSSGFNNYQNRFSDIDSDLQ